MRVLSIEKTEHEDGATAEQRLTAMYRETSPAVYGFLMARCGDSGVAGEVMSEVFLAAARAVAGDRPEQVTRTWLLTTARRRLIDHWRRQATRRRTISAFKLERHPTSTALPSVDTEAVMAALASLPQNQRLALTLRYLDDHSVAEVADELELTYQAAESLLARARRSFSRAWEAA